MTRDELRRLAIRLAMTKRLDGMICQHCCWFSMGDDPRHQTDCPIAELEAEEAASKMETPVDTSLVAVKCPHCPCRQWYRDKDMAEGLFECTRCKADSQLRDNEVVFRQGQNKVTDAP